MDSSDWIATGAAIISTLALAISFRAASYTRRQALAAERANELAEGRSWRVIRDTGTRWTLLNVSRFVATEVEIDASRIECFAPDLPEKVTIAVGDNPATDGFRFTMMGGTGQPELPSHIHVRWAEGPKKKGEPVWTPVPIER
ncbi:hypothetical protein [Nocardia asteroides]|uniref:hypothetical protein n=1 Tax=Nocardia asteroides TaxID=1824 RepID=UPI001E2B4394|nr:hypothetical protein [Nocardia asteroides]UGT54965.1 hypothetical protein LTT85_30935 [Nocardia asteroides]